MHGRPRSLKRRCRRQTRARWTRRRSWRTRARALRRSWSARAMRTQGCGMRSRRRSARRSRRKSAQGAPRRRRTRPWQPQQKGRTPLRGRRPRWARAAPRRASSRPRGTCCWRRARHSVRKLPRSKAQAHSSRRSCSACVASSPQASRRAGRRSATPRLIAASSPASCCTPRCAPLASPPAVLSPPAAGPGCSLSSAPRQLLTARGATCDRRRR